MSATTATKPRFSHGGVSPEDTWALVEKARSGDSEAFSLLYRHHFDLVHGYLHSRADFSLAEDLTSETFARALARLDRLTHHQSTFGAWLITIARNLLLDNAKAARTRYEVTMPEGWDFTDCSDDPAVGFERAQNIELVRRCLTGLTRDQRECIVLRFFLGYPVAQVAKAMNRNAGSVRALQVRATKKLALLLTAERTFSVA
ncbi:sigma-70 family RNA polymerase sigma factor [Amycolatopsis sp. K13G38]|uniref:Sigma-70 family RNA polymerase sigma factor n=1 Tax=Amycolatopsis acididurans TaxID=2724524 RepID=A0ABX1J3L4_9PSEU|nr:sigma-70 family RNA polymerase sigma factor [Amycolatopsis acididurans]NKQ54254.1 sigma-70 family RNA polymerase sigma factor [Amycolatopsis acididurans]